MDGGPIGPDEVLHVAAYFDSTGFRDWNPAVIDFTRPYVSGARWRRLADPGLVLDVDGNLTAVDLGASSPFVSTLAVVYRVVDAQGQLIAQVGDDPDLGPPKQTIVGQSDKLYYRLKLLKSTWYFPNRWLHRYALRNVYSLGSSNIAPTTFEFSIERRDGSLDPQLDELGINYFEIFGLDRQDLAGNPVADGVADIHDPAIFDLQCGLLRFPADFPEPFAATRARYEANVQDPYWDWTRSTYLTDSPVPLLYDPLTSPASFPQYARFRFVVQTSAAPGD